MKYKILIIEDKSEIIKLIQHRLDTNTFDITIAKDAEMAFNYIDKYYYDVVTLDILIPSIDGLILCQNVRFKNKYTIILVISTLVTDAEKEKAYMYGADDYFTKPFSPKILALKIKTLLKRREDIINNSLPTINNIQHNAELKLFLIESKKLYLTMSEYTILKILFSSPNKIFSKEELSQILYNEDIGNINKNGIGTHIYQIRKKIKLLSLNQFIFTIRGQGYSLQEY